MTDRIQAEAREKQAVFFNSDDDLFSVLTFDLVIAVCAMLFAILANPKRPFERGAFSLLMLLSLGLYLSWRALDTLPPLRRSSAAFASRS